MTRDELIEAIARAIRDDGGCGFTIDGGTTFCDDPRAPDDLRQNECGCKSQARAALSAIEAVAAVVPKEPTPEIRDAYGEETVEFEDGYATFDLDRESYVAMLKASPFRSKP